MAGLDGQAKFIEGSDFVSILSSQGIDCLLSGEGKVPLSSCDCKVICLFFSANWCRPCKAFAPQLVKIYNSLRNSGKKLEIVFISFDRDEDGFKEHFKCMPWLAVPFEVNLHRHLSDIYHVNLIPSFISLSSDGISAEEDMVGLIEDFDAEAFPFTRERFNELRSFDDAKRQGGKLQQLLAHEGRNYVLSGDSRKILVSELVGKAIGLYFGAHWCPPSRAFTTQLIQAYNEIITANDGCFEIILVSTDRDLKEFNVNLSNMPWLAIPYEDRTRQDLCRIFNIKEIPALVIIGQDGKIISTDGKAFISLYGAKAFPFTESRITEIEATLKKEGDELPQQVQDIKHQHALKLDMAKAYVCDCCRGQGLNQISDSSGTSSSDSKDLFLPFRCFCTRKDINCKDVILEDTDVAKALIEYVTQTAIETLIVGASAKGGFLRFKAADVAGSVSKGAPDFCNVYIISKGKIQSMRAASRSAPVNSSLHNQLNQTSTVPVSMDARTPPTHVKRAEKPPLEQPRKSVGDTEPFRSPFTRRGLTGKSYGELSVPDTDISFVSSGRPSIDRIFPGFCDNTETSRTPPRLSNFSDIDSNYSFESLHYARKSLDQGGFSPELSTFSNEGDQMLSAADDVEAEMRRLKLELKQTMEMYSSACKEALTAKQKTRELQRWKMEDEQKLEEARLAEEAALAVAEKEKAKSKAAIEAAEAAQRIAELESRKRINAEMKARKEAEEKRKALDALANTDVRYRRYSIEEIEAATNCFAQSLKIGEGGYGPVYKCYLDHTPVAIKVLRPDAAQGRSQFQQEVEKLAPACCSSTRLNPEPLVHRDLKPANILLDRNFVSKISDVGLARLVPPSIADSVTQYRMTSTAGTFCYIDPEYQQTGMLGIKSDIYSLGIMFLQILTAKPAMGLTHHVDRALEKGTFAQMLDPAVPDWPIEEATFFAKLALKCAELRRKDRPDLGKVVLPELKRMRAFAEETMRHTLSSSPVARSPKISTVSTQLNDHPSSRSEVRSRSPSPLA
ncbi:U-BOX DOMAIN-CONTAINING PROTEIN 34-LIKE [Salix koriyanagi]|uniref:RING-type E3 ubiquitin transferase n=1 Tax=Salix koriyanagi TaxID=2511006 RepID=A0A9Q0VCN7_9ROSI|nr:U-BOX DOMAIN-CONTAINING PROTEIN 34-LIKE [Salix koriyanagi]